MFYHTALYCYDVVSKIGSTYLFTEAYSLLIKRIQQFNAITVS